MANFRVKSDKEELILYLKEQTEILLKKASINVLGNSTLVFCLESIGTKESIALAIEQCAKLEKIDELRKRFWEYKKANLIN